MHDKFNARFATDMGTNCHGAHTGSANGATIATPTLGTLSLPTEECNAENDPVGKTHATNTTITIQVSKPLQASTQRTIENVLRQYAARGDIPAS